MRFIAFMAALAGLTAVGSQAVLLSTGFVEGLGESLQDYLPLVQQVGRWAQFAFIVLVTLFMFLFALSKRPTAA